MKICAINDKDSIDIARNHCAVCGKNFADKAFLFTVHLITDAEAMQKLFGKMVLVEMSGRKLAGRVAEPDSQCTKEGKNLGFVVCSEKCREILKSIVRENIPDFGGEKEEGKKENIEACPHLESLRNDLQSGVISKEHEEEMLKTLGLHGIEGPDGAAVLMCTECYKNGDFVYREDRNGKRYHLRWPIELDEFKGKGGE